MENEIWKDIVGYEQLYQVSNFGRVKSVQRVVKSTGTNRTFRSIPERILKTQNGSVTLHKDNHATTYNMNDLMSSHF